MPTLTEQAQKAAVESVQAKTPQQFTIGAYVNEKGQLTAAVTYDRKVSNLWGLTAYAKAYWLDLSVTAHPKLEAGIELSRKF